MSVLTATYWIETDDPRTALTALCRGQSVGNPTILTSYETKAFLEKWAATGKVTRQSQEGVYVMVVRFPERNFGTEGLNYLLSVLLGGQCDIDVIRQCRLMQLDPGSQARHWGYPRFGISGLRRLLHIETRAFVGGILKPKIGLTPTQLAEVVRQMADGGCDLIKEDEILADQRWCPMRARLPLVKRALQGYPVLYLASVTADGSEAWVKARAALRWGASGVHLNVWSSLGTYLDVWKHVHAPLHFQKSGDKVWTTGPYSMDATVLCQLVHLAGCDLAHVGMWGGYLAESRECLQRRITALGTTLPTFSCGMTPALAHSIVTQFGRDIAIFSGGWIHGQAGQSVAESCRLLRKSVDAASHAWDDEGRMVHRGLPSVSPVHEAL